MAAKLFASTVNYIVMLQIKLSNKTNKSSHAQLCLLLT